MLPASIRLPASVRSRPRPRIRDLRLGESFKHPDGSFCTVCETPHSSVETPPCDPALLPAYRCVRVDNGTSSRHVLMHCDTIVELASVRRHQNP
jgi:hypothetical protein